MHIIKQLRNQLIIEVGGTYALENDSYEVITATSGMVEEKAEQLTLTELVYHLKHTVTGDMKYVAESTLRKELPKYNEVVALF